MHDKVPWLSVRVHAIMSFRDHSFDQANFLMPLFVIDCLKLLTFSTLTWFKGI